MNEPSNKKLYQKVKKKITASNPKHSAYRSASIVKQYKSELKKISPNKKPIKGVGLVISLIVMYIVLMLEYQKRHQQHSLNYLNQE